VTGLDPLLGTREIATPQHMHALGEEIGGMLRPGQLVVLTGALGAGKTTLTRGIAQALGVRGPVQSPTFVIARTHPSLTDGPPLVHVDAYRLGSGAELDDLGIDFDSSIVVAEWAAPFASAVAGEWWEIELDRGSGPVDDDLELDADAPRRVTISRRP